MVRKVPAVVLALALAAPTVGAVEATVDMKVSAYDLIERHADLADTDFSGNVRENGKQGRVREYDGRRAGSGALSEADLSVNSDFGSVLLDLGFKDLGSYGEKARADINVGSWIRLTGGLNRLTHRQPIIQGGHVMDGRWYSTAEASIPGAFNVTDWARQFPEDLSFERVESRGKLSLSRPSYPLRLVLALWQEHEYGNRAHHYYASGDSQVAKQAIDRTTRDITGALEAGVGEGGHVSYELLARKFVDRALSKREPAYSGYYGAWDRRRLNYVSDQRVIKHTLTASHRFSRNLSVAFGAASRNRKHHYNGYEMRANSAHAGVAYKPTKNLAFTARMYGRATKTTEDYGNSQAQMTGGDAGVDNIDFYSYRGDFKASYRGFKNVALKLGYKPEHNRRRNAGNFIERETFLETTRFQDGTRYIGGETVNPVEMEDTRHTITAGADFALPGDAEFSLGWKQFAANRGAYQALPDRGSDQTASLTVPMSRQSSFMTAGGSQYSANSESPFAHFTNRKYWIDTGVAWSQESGRTMLGMNYAVEWGRNITDQYYGTVGAYGMAGPQGTKTGPLHIRMPHQFKNQTLSANASALVVKNLRVLADASYTHAKGDYWTGGAMNKVNGVLGGVSEWTNANPTNIEIYAAGGELEYAITKDMKVNAGYRQQVYLDHYLGDDEGRVQVVKLSVSGKF